MNNRQEGWTNTVDTFCLTNAVSFGSRKWKEGHVTWMQPGTVIQDDYYIGYIFFSFSAASPGVQLCTWRRWCKKRSGSGLSYPCQVCRASCRPLPVSIFISIKLMFSAQYSKFFCQLCARVCACLSETHHIFGSAQRQARLLPPLMFP